MIKKLLVQSSIILTLFSNVQADKFIAIDIPAMHNMQLNEPIELDSANGSIIQTSTFTTKTKQQVFSFYKKELPNLGWKKVNNTTYSRNGETLIISFGEKQKNKLNIDFTIITPFE